MLAKTRYGWAVIESPPIMLGDEEVIKLRLTENSRVPGQVILAYPTKYISEYEE